MRLSFNLFGKRISIGKTGIKYFGKGSKNLNPNIIINNKHMNTSIPLTKSKLGKRRKINFSFKL